MNFDGMIFSERILNLDFMTSKKMINSLSPHPRLSSGSRLRDRKYQKLRTTSGLEFRAPRWLISASGLEPAPPSRRGRLGDSAPDSVAGLRASRSRSGPCTREGTPGGENMN